MKRFAVALSVTAAALVVALVRPTATAQDKKAVQLFNGKDLTGWKIHPMPSKQITQVFAKAQVNDKEKGSKVVGYDGKLTDGKVVPLWRVEEGILIGSGPASHLFSERGDYVNFTYTVEAMINDKGNSGQYFRTAFGPNFPKGYEAQINATHTDQIRTGSLYLPNVKEVLVLKDAPHKPDEWFTQEVTAKGNHIVIMVNGKKTVDYKDEKNTHSKGHFALQGHDPGTVVKFKRIEVIELP